MKTALILHGRPDEDEYYDPKNPGESQKHWLPWLKNKLIKSGIASEALEFPEPYEPVYEGWSSVFERFKINEETILIGHSCGAGFLVRWLSEHKANVEKVVLIAPWLDPDHTLKTGFFDFEIDPTLIDHVKHLILFYSSDDDKAILMSVKRLREAFSKAELYEFSEEGHFTFDDMKTREFPKLLEVVLENTS